MDLEVSAEFLFFLGREYVILDGQVQKLRGVALVR
jgi:hypothetical protein